MSPSIRAEAVSVAFGPFTAVDEVTLDIEPGEFVSLLGPSGSGKTTTLRVIAGFVAPQSGRVLVGDRDITGLSPRYRDFGMVFQHYALFPHMTVHDNVAFGLRTRRVPRREAAAQVAEALSLVGLDGLARRYPGQLSGGQQQRVALARAVVIRPRLLLMDEPLGALDLKMRQQLQVEIRRLQRELGVSTLYVTHDQEEAFSMSDRVVVMNAGRISSQGPPDELYRRPTTVFTASFVGNNTLIPVEPAALADRATVTGLPGQTGPFRLAAPLDPATSRVVLVLRPEQLTARPVPSPGAASGTIVGRRLVGMTPLVTIAVGDLLMLALDPDLALADAAEAYVSWNPAHCHVIEEDAGGVAVRTAGQYLVTERADEVGALARGQLDER